MRLRLLEKKDAEGMLEWMHDPEISRYFRFNALEMTREKADSFIEVSRIKAERREEFHFAVADEQDGYMGTISLKSIDWKAGSAEYAISLRSGAQGKGYACAATHELLRYAFGDLMLNRVYLNVLSDNRKAIKLYEKCGFIYEGEFRQHILVSGKLKSLKWYGMLKSEFKDY